MEEKPSALETDVGMSDDNACSQLRVCPCVKSTGSPSEDLTWRSHPSVYPHLFDPCVLPQVIGQIRGLQANPLSTANLPWSAKRLPPALPLDIGHMSSYYLSWNIPVWDRWYQYCQPVTAVWMSPSSVSICIDLQICDLRYSRDISIWFKGTTKHLSVCRVKAGNHYTHAYGW